MTNAPLPASLPNGTADATFAALFEELADRVRRGEDAAAVAAEYPAHADRLRRLLPAVAWMAGVGSEPGADLSFPPADADAGSAAGELGDFRIVREVGRGGMGIVYEAEQISLGRRVALKVLPFAATLDPRHLQRFKNEARAAASLHHEHIVPVYGVGEARGVHYYAMQFVDGLPLSDLIRAVHRSATESLPTPAGDATVTYQGDDTPHPTPADAPATPPAGALSTLPAGRTAAFYKRVAELAIQAAEALEHAHALGVVHRDIKPGNLLVDNNGKLWVSDFGLAKVASADANLTGTGDVLGTLRYMAPEQALAKHDLVDHRADLYSLGATVYELLTGHPTVEGTDKADILRKIANEDPVAPRKLDRSIPADLETVVLKCLRKEPDERYAAAGELAADLRRYLGSEPVRAKRPGPAARASKWARRNRPLVWSAAVVVLVALAAGGAAIGWVVRNAAEQRKRTEVVLGPAVDEAEALLASGKWREARAVVARAEGAAVGGRPGPELASRFQYVRTHAELIGQFEEAHLLASEVKADHFNLELGRGEYSRILRSCGMEVFVTSPECAVKLVPPTARVTVAGYLFNWANDGDIDAVQKSWLIAFVDLADPDDWRTAFRRAVLGNDTTTVARMTADPRVETLPTSCLRLLRHVLKRPEDVRPVIRVLETVQRRRPDDFWVNVKLAELYSQGAQSNWDQALRYYSMALAARPDSPGAYYNVGYALWKKGDRESAKAFFQEAVRLKPDYAGAHEKLGVMLNEQGRFAEAEGPFRAVVHIRPEYPEGHDNLGLVLLAGGRRVEAEAEFRETIRLDSHYAPAHDHLGLALRQLRHFQEAEAAHREAIRLGPDHWMAHNNLGLVLKETGRIAEAEKEYREAIRLDPDSSQVHLNFGVVLLDLGRPIEAETECREAIRLRSDSPVAHNALGEALYALDRLDDGEKEYREAIRLDPSYVPAYVNLGALLADRRHNPKAAEAAFRQALRLKADEWTIHFNLGVALSKQDRRLDTAEAFRSAVRLVPKDSRTRNQLADALRHVGALDEAVALCQDIIRSDPNFAPAHCNLGLALQDRGQFTDALAALRRAHKLAAAVPPYQSQVAEWIRECERMAALDDRLTAVRTGRVRTAGPKEAVALASFALQSKKLPRLAARLYADAFDADPTTLLPPQLNRYNAACAAVLSAAGDGADAKGLPDVERASLRNRARTWLTDDLVVWEFIAAVPAGRLAARCAIDQWHEDPDLASVRGPALDRLPLPERDAWRRLWTAADNLVGIAPTEIGPPARVVP